ncbi:uncharacterized protein PRCAT00000221001 [Priceomyces carsonii]|uniref:uncharacterized protein n=1 Tax=Priceomyces carsonii TaxID=28549 RepID=UPI002ED8B7A0|nr:unnamed protein product [Priceomyces carsonii]
MENRYPSDRDAFETLDHLSKKWFPRAPKKFNKNHINDIHKLLSIESNDGLLQILLDKRYFDNVLWPNFEKDASNNHIELIMVLTLFESKVGTGIYFDIQLDDEVLFEQLLRRLLEQTRTFNDSVNLKLHSIIWIYFSELVNTKQQHSTFQKSFLPLFEISTWENIPQYSLLLSNESKSAFQSKKNAFNEIKDKHSKALAQLKSGWIYRVLNNYMSRVVASDFEDLIHINTMHEKYFIVYLEALLYFLNSIVSQLKTRLYMITLIEKIGFVSSFARVNEKYSKLMSFVDLLWFYLNYPLENRDKYGSRRFYRLQITLNELFSDSNACKTLSMVPSIVDITTNELCRILKGYKINELEEIAQALNVLQHVVKEYKVLHFLVDLIKRYVFLPGYNLKEIQKNYFDFNEKSLFEELGLTDFSNFGPLMPINRTHALSFEDFINRLASELSFKFRRELNCFLKQVLSRMKISYDSSSNLSVKGSSKYMTQIHNISRNFEIIELLTKENKEWEVESLQSGDIILLLEIIKPNKYSPYDRVKQYGLNIICPCEVLQVSRLRSENQLILKSFISIEDVSIERFNYILKVSYGLTSQHRLLSRFMSGILVGGGRLPMFIAKLFIDMKFDGSIKHPKLLKFNCLSENFLFEEFDREKLPKKKKRKIKHGILLSPIKPCLLTLNSETRNYDVKGIKILPNEVSLTFEQSKALVSCLSEKLTLVEAVPSSGVYDLLNCILSNMNLNFSAQRVLIILPNRATLDQFDISGEMKHLSLKYKEDFFEIQLETFLKYVDSYLKDVEQLASFLGMENEGYQESCFNALCFFELHISRIWNNFVREVDERQDKLDDITFPSFLGFIAEGKFDERLQIAIESYSKIRMKFDFLGKMAPLLKLNTAVKKINYLLNCVTKYVFVTADDIVPYYESLFKFNFKGVIALGNKDIVPSLLPAFNNERMKRLIIINDPVTERDTESLYAKCRLSEPTIKLTKVKEVRREFFDAFSSFYEEITYVDSNLPLHNPGFKHTWQLINVNELGGPHDASLQEAEYCVLLYKYMRLLGYPTYKVCITVHSSRQRMLIDEILTKECGKGSVRGSKDFSFDIPVVDLYSRCAPHDFIIASLVGADRSSQPFPFNLARRGLYIVANIGLQKETPNHRRFQIPKEMPSGELEICLKESYTSECSQRTEEQLLTLKDLKSASRYVTNMFNDFVKRI